MPFDPEEILRVLEAHGVDYIVIGGLAATIHGSAHVTTDVDITPSRSRENLARLSAALKDLGARIRVATVPDGIPFDHDAESLERIQILNLTTRAGDLDISFTPSGTEGFADLRRNAQIVDLDGLRIRVASLADVVRSKEAAGRPKDFLTLPTLRRLLDEGYLATAELLAGGEVLLVLRSPDPRVTPLTAECVVHDPRGQRLVGRDAQSRATPGRIEFRYPTQFDSRRPASLVSGEYAVSWVERSGSQGRQLANPRVLARTRFRITPDGRFE
jgi:hypothetical protein